MTEVRENTDKAVFEGKVFGFEKEKTKVFTVSFRLDKEHNDMLQYLFTNLDIKPKKDTQTEKMLELIEKIYERSKGFQQFDETKKEYDKKVAQLESVKATFEESIKKHGVAPAEKPFQEPVFKDAPAFKEDAVPSERAKMAYERAKFKYVDNVKVDFGSERDLVQVTLPDVKLPSCLRHLSTGSVDRWLEACEICEVQTVNIFDKCATSMKQRYVSSKAG